MVTFTKVFKPTWLLMWLNAKGGSNAKVFMWISHKTPKNKLSDQIADTDIKSHIIKSEKKNHSNKILNIYVVRFKESITICCARNHVAAIINIMTIWMTRWGQINWQSTGLKVVNVTIGYKLLPSLTPFYNVKRTAIHSFCICHSCIISKEPNCSENCRHLEVTLIKLMEIYRVKSKIQLY